MSQDPNQPIFDLYHNAQELLSHDIYRKAKEKIDQDIGFAKTIIILCLSIVIPVLGFSTFSAYKSFSEIEKTIKSQETELLGKVKKLNQDIAAINKLREDYEPQINDQIKQTNNELSSLRNSRTILTNELERKIETANKSNNQLTDSFYQTKYQTATLEELATALREEQNNYNQTVKNKIEQLDGLEKKLKSKIEEINNCHILPVRC